MGISETSKNRQFFFMKRISKKTQQLEMFEFFLNFWSILEFRSNFFLFVFLEDLSFCYVKFCQVLKLSKDDEFLSWIQHQFTQWPEANTSFFFLSRKIWIKIIFSSWKISFVILPNFVTFLNSQNWNFSLH